MPAHIHSTIVQFASNLVLRVHGSLFSSVSGCTWLIQNHRVPRVPLLGVGVAHYQDGFESHLRRHYSSFTAYTDSCARPYPSQRLGLPLYAESLQVVASPCWETALPDIISAILVQVQGPLPRSVPSVHLPVSSRRTSVSPQDLQVRHAKYPLQCNFNDGATFRGCSHSITFKLPYLLDPLVAPTTEPI